MLSAVGARDAYPLRNFFGQNQKSCIP